MGHPEWFANAVIYHIFIDRFAGFQDTRNWKRHQFLGGNLQGVIEKLDYISQLGANTIWLSPFYETSSYHGYHITDYFNIDKRFGTLSTLRSLISEAHRRKIRVITDFVPNHCSVRHPMFIDACLKRHSSYHNWFAFTHWPDDYRCFLQYKELPKLNLYYRETVRYMLESAKYWLQMGLCGFRIDHVVGLPHRFLLQLRDEVKKTNPEAVLIGEAWFSDIRFRDLPTLGISNKWFKWLMGVNQEKIQREYIGVLDGVLDFSFRDLLLRYMVRPGKTAENMKLLAKAIQVHYQNYPPGFFLPTFLDNHDTSRFLSECNGDKELFKEALKVQFQSPQPAIIYYGTETGLYPSGQTDKNERFNDILARQPMPWKKLDQALTVYVNGLISDRAQRHGVN